MSEAIEGSPSHQPGDSAGRRTIVHFSTAYTWRGGEQQALWLADGLRTRGYPTVIIAPPVSPLAERGRAAGLEVKEIDCRGEYDLSAVWRVARLLRHRRAAAVHAHDGHAVTIAALAGRLAGAKRVCTRRVDFPLRGLWKYRWGMERVICISEAVKRVCTTCGLEEEKMRVVRSGIDFTRLAEPPAATIENLRAEIAAHKAKGKARPLIVLNLASLVDHKGQRWLLEAMSTVLAHLPQTVLAIAGEGELADDLAHRCKVLGIENDVRFLGFREDAPALIHACDLFVMSSHLEGLCTSAMDAMAAGKAVVVTSAGGLPELVENEKTGIVVPPRDAEALAAGMLRVLEDRKLRNHLGRQAQLHAHKHFGREKMVEGTLRVYEELGIAAFP